MLGWNAAAQFGFAERVVSIRKNLGDSLQRLKFSAKTWLR